MGDTPKVLIVATHPVQYQVPWFRYLHNNIQNYNFEVLYLTLPDAEQQGAGFGQSFEWDIPLLDGYNWIKVENEFLAGDGNIDKFSSLRLKNTRGLLKTLNPDAVFLTGWQCLALIQVLIECNRVKIPTLIRGDSNNLKPRKMTTQLLHKLLLKRFDQFLAVGKSNKNFYLQNGISESNIYFCPHFIDNKRFVDDADTFSKQRETLRKQWNVPERAFCFCYVGKLNPKKRIMDVLNSFKNLADNRAHLLVVGDGELMQQAKDYADKQNLNVTFSGFLNQSEIAKAYAVSECLVLASDFDETWGLVVNEAMASGLPAITSDRCGCHLDLVINDETGYIFEFANIRSLTAKMKKIISLDGQALGKLADQAKTNLLENYSLEKASEGLIKALDNSLGAN